MEEIKNTNATAAFTVTPPPQTSSTNTTTTATTTTTTTTSTLELQQKKWMFQNKYPIAYEVARIISAGHATTDASAMKSGDGAVTMIAEDEDEVVVPILLLNGFGVGSFHQHRLMRQLLLLMLLQHDDAEYNHRQHHINHEKQQQQHQRPRRRQQLVIYGIDYLGQGESWPITCNGDGTSEDELNLGYSADVWLDQLNDFINEVVLGSSSSSSSSSSEDRPATTAAVTTTTTTTASSSSSHKKVHLIGNSVGGYLATILTHRHPHNIASLTLLNATPVWGLNLPGWDGRLPPPPLPKYVGGKLFEMIRDPNVINMYLQTAYVHPEAYDGTYEDCFYGPEGLKKKEEGGSENENVALGVKIRACTEKGGHAAFASILYSAPASEWKTTTEGRQSAMRVPVDFYSTLQAVPVDVLLLFGADDPWCTPAIAKRMHLTLSKRNDDMMTANVNDGRVIVSPAQRYISLENVGHCPNHEAPRTVAKVVLPWIRASATTTTVDGQQQSIRHNIPLVAQDGSEETQEPWGVVRAHEVSLDESKDLGMIDRIVSSMVG